jgi:hypothetical protein
VSRVTYIFAGPPGSARVLMAVIEAAVGGPFSHEPGTDPYIRADPITVYVGAHEFDDGDMDAPDGQALALQTSFPLLVDIRDVDRDADRQQDAAARIFAAIKADGRLTGVFVDDMQHVLDTTDGALPAARPPLIR